MKEDKMEILQETINEYRRQLEKGIIQKAYQGLMEYMMSLKTHFQKNYPDLSVPGGIYYGYMDMTYFPVITKSLKERDLKTAVVFLHEEFRFEVWLSGKNKQVLKKYWKLFSECGWDNYEIVSPEKGIDFIVVHILADNPDFSNLPALTNKLERGILKFINDIESFLSKNKTAF